MRASLLVLNSFSTRSFLPVSLGSPRLVRFLVSRAVSTRLVSPHPRPPLDSLLFLLPRRFSSLTHSTGVFRRERRRSQLKSRIPTAQRGRQPHGTDSKPDYKLAIFFPCTPGRVLVRVPFSFAMAWTDGRSHGVCEPACQASAQVLTENYLANISTGIPTVSVRHNFQSELNDGRVL